MESKKGYGLTILRIVTGLLFLVPGIMKLMNPSGITGLLNGIGFPLPSLLAWVLLLSEIVFGALLIVGWKTRYTIWPLLIVISIATITVAIPGASGNPMGWINVLFHLVAIASLLSIFFEGPGIFALSK